MVLISGQLNKTILGYYDLVSIVTANLDDINFYAEIFLSSTEVLDINKLRSDMKKRLLQLNDVSLHFSDYGTFYKHIESLFMYYQRPVDSLIVVNTPGFIGMGFDYNRFIISIVYDPRNATVIFTLSVCEKFIDCLKEGKDYYGYYAPLIGAINTENIFKRITTFGRSIKEMETSLNITRIFIDQNLDQLEESSSNREYSLYPQF